MKHYDFLIVDFITLQITYILAYLTRHGWQRVSEVYQEPRYLSSAIVLAITAVAFSVMTENHKDILKRGLLIEIRQVIKLVIACTMCILAYLFFTKEVDFSRLVVAYFYVYSLILDTLARTVWKKWLLTKGVSDNQKRHILLITTKEYAHILANRLKAHEYGGLDIIGVVLADGDTEPCGEKIQNEDAGCDDIYDSYRIGEKIDGIKIVSELDNLVGNIQNRWVDEILIYVPRTALDDKLAKKLEKIRSDVLMMGLATHDIIDFDPEGGNMRTVEDVCGFECLTESIHMATTGQLLIKRIMDIAGGLVGLILTAVLTVIIGPMIKIADPKGGIFFKQIRVGRNGRQFPIYKFRSMYVDAEERKKELAEQNKTGDARLFKIDNDPRILGSGPDGMRHGIGWFIRRTSIDEFPQFWSVLIGHMSLVGTRPPTVDEWKQYDLHHRARLAIKPGLTGLWQVSGRSNITDFEEVVKLDLKYIKNWGIREDIKIILKTIQVVITGYGAE